MPDVLCEHCTGACCQYVALPIDTPRTRAQFDDVRWYLLHENISVFVEDGDWYISMQTRCRHLEPDGRCGIYETRPRICRSYSTSDCDYHSGDYGWEAHFTCAAHLDAYVERKFSKKRKLKNNEIMDNIEESEKSESFKNLMHAAGHGPNGHNGNGHGNGAASRLTLPVLGHVPLRTAGRKGVRRRRLAGGRTR